MLIKQILLLLIIVFGASDACKTLNGSRVRTYDKEGLHSELTLTGCVNPSTFARILSIRRLFFDGSIPILYKNSVTYLEDLVAMGFYKCGVKVIERGAFEHLPKLKNLVLSHNEITKLDDYSFDGLQIVTLRIDFNQIEEIPTNAFRGMTNLHYFYANFNQLSQFNNEWLRYSSWLRRVSFNSNKLQVIPRKAFYYNKNLQIIELENNYIELVETGAFEGVERLEILALANNRIRLLNDDAFPSKIAINVLTINGNRLNFLSGDLLRKLNVSSFAFDENPWNCYCLNALNNWCIIGRTNVLKMTWDFCQNPRVCVQSLNHNETKKCVERYDDEAVNYYLNSIYMCEN